MSNAKPEKPKIRRRTAVLGALISLFLVSALAAEVVYAGNRIPDGRHWADGSLSREFVTIVDNTGSAWPVYAAAIEWDKAPKLDVVYQYGSCGGSPGNCIGVQVLPASEYLGGGVPCTSSSGPYSAGYAAYAPYSSSNNHFDPDRSYIRFNGACGSSSYTNRDRRAVACEEEGHIIGLDHADASLYESTCMVGVQISRQHETPRTHDFELLDNIYTHSH